MSTVERELLPTADGIVRKPYPGPQPFAESDRLRFFGRTREISELRSLVLSSGVSLLYAASGAGKSSLIQAGLIPRLRERGVVILPVLTLRRRPQAPAAPTITNPYVRSLAANWAIAAAAPDQSARTDVRARRLPEISDLAGLVSIMAEDVEGDPNAPRLLIIDQFEELFTDQPEHWRDRDGLFVQLNAALEADQCLRVLLAMREDFLPQLEPFAALVSNRLQRRMRIDTLSERQAREAITLPVRDSPHPFTDAAADHLVAQLMQIQVESEGQTHTVPGRTVEPVQLQVVCQALWDELPPDVGEISVEFVRRHGDVDRVLSRFYDDAIRGAAAAQRRVRARRLRRWIERELITSVDTRGTSDHAEAAAAGVPEASLRVLIDRHLLRGEYRNGTWWYELTHDRLIKPIQASNRAAREQREHWMSIALGAVGAVAAAAAILAVLLSSGSGATSVRTRTVTSTTTQILASTSPTPPTIQVPNDGAVYRSHQLVVAQYSCRPTRTWSRPRCAAPAPVGSPIDTSSTGRHAFTVSASYGRADIVTTRRVTYTVVAFQPRSLSLPAFQVSYPTTWRVAAAGVQRAGYTDTQIVAGSDRLLQIDVTPRISPNLRVKVMAEVRALAREPRYRELSLSSVRLAALRGSGVLAGASHLRELKLARVAVAGIPGIEWQFVVLQHGVLVRKDDVFFNDAADHEEFAVLTAAPARRYPAEAALFAQMRATIVLR